MRYNTAAQKFVSAVSSAFILFNSIAPYALVLTSQPLPAPQVIAQEVPTSTPEVTSEPTTEPTSEPSVEPTSEPVTETPTEAPTTEPTQLVSPSSSPSENTQQENSNAGTAPTQSTEPTNASVATPTVQVVPTISDENAHIDSTVVSSNQCFADSLNGCEVVTTDKADYAPTDIVILKGSGFSPGKTYLLVITSENAPAVRFEAPILTDNEGNFTASYQLDGNYRPDYVVQVYDANTLVARTTFTDSNTADFVPTATHTPNDWTVNTVANVQSSNDVYASDNGEADQQGYANFGFPAIPAGATIDGVEVKIEAKSSDASGCQLETQLSWNNGTSNTSIKTANLTGTDAINTFGGATDKWGRTWAPGEFTNANFVVKIAFDDNSGNNCSGSTVSVDHIQAKVYYTEVSPTATPTVITPTAGPTGAPIGGATIDNSCIDDLVDGPINCTANDVSIANVQNIVVLDDGCTSPSDTVTFRADWVVQSTATQRYNVGLWFAKGGQSSALQGSCSISTLPYAPVPPWYNYDSNVCGDISSAAPVNPSLTLTVACIPDANNYLNLPYCTSWDQNADACTGPLDTLPGAPSKCNCQDGFSVPIIVPHFAKIEVVKDLVPSNDSGTFKLQVDSTDKTSCIGDNGTTGQVAVAAGTSAQPGAVHTVGESACAGTTSSNYSSSITCVKRGTQTVVATASGTGPLNVPVAKDDDIVCTVTNTVNQGQLKIVKNTSGDNGTFNFNVSGPSASTPAITTANNTGTTGFVSVNTGAYAVAETVPAGWNLASASCVNAAGAPIGTSGATGVTGVTVGPNDQITCTFNDTRLRDITACKYEDENGDADRTGDTMLSGWEMTLNPGNVKQTTDQNGCTTFNDLLPGQYSVTETLKTDWTNTTPLSQNVTLVSSADQTVYFGNFACATVTGSKWEDLNGNGTWDQGEPTVANWPISLSGQSDAQTTTDANGNYSFKVCKPGIHVVAEGTLDANTWYQTFPATEYYDVTVESGDSYTGNDFGNAKYARIYGFKYEDNDGDGQLDANDLLDTLGGWVFELYNGTTNVLITSYTTLLDGFYEFTGLLAGNTYYVKEQQQAGWTQTYGPTNVTPTPMGVVSGQQTQINFANFQNISISGTKFNDLDGDGIRLNEPALQGWTIFIDANNNQTLDQGETSTTTDQNGAYSFSNLGPGTYDVCEVAQNNWVQTSTPTCHTVVAASGQNATNNDFGNQGRGTLILKKVLNPTNDTTLWDMEVDGEYASASSTLGHNQTDQHTLPTGEYNIVETPDETVTEDLYDSSYSCIDEEDAVVASGQGRMIDDLDINTGETVTCTFTNVARGSITIIKDANPNSAQDFSFSATGTGSFSLDDDADNTLSNTIEIPSLVNGVYTFTEGEVAGWDLTGLSCTDGQSTTPSTVDLQTRVATVNLDPGENVTCTFVNTERGSIGGQKLEDADGDLNTTDDQSPIEGWTIELYQWIENAWSYLQSTLTDVLGFFSFTNLVPGNYEVREVMPTSGWTALSPTGVPVGLVAGEESTGNDFINFENVSVTVCKVIDLDGSTTTTIDQSPYAGWPVSLLVDEEVADEATTGRDGCYTWSNLGPGHVYGTEEGNVTGYVPVGATSHSFGQAQSGSEYSHTFVNQGRGTITVVKNVDTDGDGDIDTQDATDWTWDIANVTSDESTGSTNNVDVASGEYTINEDQKDNYHITSVSCTGEEGTSASESAQVTVSAGENVVCTFVNTRDTGEVNVLKYHDLNANGTRDEGEELLSDWTINLDEDSAVTGEDGEVTFNPVTGEYVLTEVIPEDWMQSNIACSLDEEGIGTYDEVKDTLTLPVGTDEVINCEIGNYQRGTINVTKRVLNPNGDEVEDTTTDFTFTINPEIAEFALTDDESESSSVLPGEYTVNETANEDYDFVGCRVIRSENELTQTLSLQVDSQETINVECINRQKTGDITVIKRVVDSNGEEVLDTSTDFDFVINPEVASFPLTDDGEHVEAVNPGTYTVVETPDENYDFVACEAVYDGGSVGISVENGKEVTLGSNDNVVVTCTNKQKAGRIIVTKYSDDNGNGVRDEGEEVLSGWEMNVTKGENVLSESTGEDGKSDFDDLNPGTYTVGETQQEGWTQTGISCDVEETNPTATPTPSVTGEPTATPTPEIFTGGLCHWNEGADKWNALAVEIDNPGHDGHELDFPYNGPREDNGHPDNKTGDDWCEENDPNQSFETQGLIDQAHAAEVDVIDEPKDTEDVKLASGQTINCEIGNQAVDPVLTIAKSNNTGGADKTPGSDVVYTLVITASESAGLAQDVQVVDLPPDGFKYRGGSWTAISDLRGNLKTLGVTTEPTYHSPGTWELGDMQPGEVVTLTYVADIANDQSFGKYPDLAWAQGESVGGDDVLAMAQPQGYVDTNFVGTEVNLNGAPEGLGTDIKKEEKGKVLGASTLPATGANTGLLTLALSLIIGGLAATLLGFSMKMKKGKVSKTLKGILKNIGVFVALMFIVGFTQKTYAADVSVRIEDPASANKTAFDIKYVALDLQGRTMTAQCFKKGPSDGSFSQFGPTQNLAAGGDADACAVNSGIINTNGTYQFFVRGTAGADVEESAVVSYDYNTTGPGTPTEYSKERFGCGYKIFFKTSTEGSTTRVEIYRSDSTSFTANESSRVGTVNIGPNTQGQFENSVPDCGKTYYYVVRAFNSDNVGSGLVGDTVVTIVGTETTSTTSTTAGGSTAGGAIPVGGSNIAQEGGEGAAAGEEGTTGEEGAATEEGANPDVQGAEDVSPTGNVLGLATRLPRIWYIAGGLGLIVLASGAYFFYNRRNK